MDNILQHRKQYFITIVQNYLCNHNIEYAEYETNSGSHYFHLNLNNCAYPCIRISDHKQNKLTTHCQTLLYNLGLNTKNSKIKQKIERTLTNTIKCSCRYSTYQILKQISNEVQYGRRKKSN